MARIHHNLTCGLLVIPVLGFGPTAYAAEWDTSFGVSPSLVFTDNVCLEDTNKKSEWIQAIEPTVKLDGQGARANVSLSGALKFPDSAIASAAGRHGAVGCVSRP